MAAATALRAITRPRADRADDGIRETRRTMSRPRTQSKRGQAHFIRVKKKGIKALARLRANHPSAAEPPPNIRFPDPPQLRPPLISLHRVSTGYVSGKPVLSKLDLRLDPEIGANGNGKTTLARLLAGRLAPFAGEVTRSPKLAWTAGCPEAGHTSPPSCACIMRARENGEVEPFGWERRHGDRGGVGRGRARFMDSRLCAGARQAPEANASTASLVQPRARQSRAR